MKHYNCFLINETKNYTKSKSEDVVNTKVCTFEYWCQEENRMKTNNMESKLRYFLNIGKVFNMFKFQKDRNKIHQKDGYSPSKIQTFTLILLSTAVYI